MAKQSANHRPKPHGLYINIATPCYGSTYTSAYVASLTRLLHSWQNSPVRYSFSEVDTSDIEFSRNTLLTNFYYNQKDASHILFIDTDMGYESSMINKMLMLKEDVVGVVAPKRSIDLSRLHGLGAESYKKAMAQSVSFVCDAPAQTPKNGFISVNWCGAGILLISRKCVTTMIETCPDIIDVEYHKSVPFANNYQFGKFLTPFNRVVVDGNRLSEDFSFCYRWKNNCAGSIYANIDTPIRHVGDQVVESRYMDLFA